MSYILDALRRADAERQRGAVPGLHAQPVAGLMNQGATAPGAPARRLGLAAAALLLLGLAVAAGWLLRPGVAPGAAGAGQPAPALAVGPAAATPPAVAQAPQVPAQVLAAGARPAAPPLLPPALAPAPPGLAVPTPALRAPPALPSAMPVQPAAATRWAATVASSPPPTAEMAPAPAPAPAQLAPAAAPARWPSLAELPEAQKRELGPLVVGGAMHAEQAALRIVILNGQVFHEGDKLSPELQVQQIRLKSVVLSHRGQRFELPF